MPSEEQTYRQFLDHRLSEQDKTLSKILTQTTTTNGRVLKLERWQSYVIGFCACITIFIVPVLLLAVSKILGL